MNDTATTKAVEALREYGALCAVTLETVARRFECSIDDASDARENRGQNALALAVAAGITEEAAAAIVTDAEAKQLTKSNPWAK